MANQAEAQAKEQLNAIVANYMAQQNEQKYIDEYSNINSNYYAKIKDNLNRAMQRSFNTSYNRYGQNLAAQGFKNMGGLLNQFLKQSQSGIGEAVNEGLNNAFTQGQQFVQQGLGRKLGYNDQFIKQQGMFMEQQQANNASIDSFWNQILGLGGSMLTRYMFPGQFGGGASITPPTGTGTSYYNPTGNWG